MPVPQPEDVLDLADELKRARERVLGLEAQWLSFFSQASNSNAAAPLNLKGRIVRFLEERPDVSYNMMTIAKSLDANENSVGPYLSELAKDGKIEKRDRGLYGAHRGPDPDSEHDDIPF